MSDALETLLDPTRREKVDRNERRMHTAARATSATN